MKRFEPSTATDEALLVRFEQVRDRSAFAEIVRRHGPMVLATASRRLNNIEDAKDAFQATFLALAKGVERLRDKTRLAGWLHTTARKTASSIRRRSQGESERIQQFSQMAMLKETVDVVVDDEVLGMLDEEIDKLPNDLRIVIVMCHLEGMNQRSVARELKIHANTVRERLIKGKDILRRRLERRGVTISLGALIAATADRLKIAEAAVTQSLVSDTTTEAIRFASAQLAAEVGVNQNAVQVANGVLVWTAMQKVVLSTLAVLSILVVGFSGVRAVSTTFAQPTLFVDDFSDGNISDGYPGTWVPGGSPGGTRVAKNGDMVISTTETNMSTWITELEGIADVSLQAQFKFDKTTGNTDSFALFARSDVVQGQRGGASYTAGIMDSGMLFIVNSEIQNKALAMKRSPLDPVGRDVILRFDVSDDVLQLSAWHAGESKPDVPQLSVVDRRLTNGGHIGFSLAPNTVGGSELAIVSVREFSAFPRP